MKCPICGTALPLQSDRCPDCGFRCRAEQAQASKAEPSQASVPTGRYTPPNQTKKSRCCCCALAIVIPAVILIAVLIVLAVSQVSQGLPEEVMEEFYEEFPFEELIPESRPLPDAADERCFQVRNGTLMFLPEKWDGSPVLRVPDYIDGEAVTTIGPGCFSGCDGLTTIVLPDTLTIIKPDAFSGCSRLRGLFLPQGLETIGANAFSGCIELEAIYVPGSVTSIAPGCFADCASLLYIFYEGNYEDWNSLYDGYITPFTAAICLDGSFYHGVQG